MYSSAAKRRQLSDAASLATSATRSIASEIEAEWLPFLASGASDASIAQWRAFLFRNTNRLTPSVITKVTDLLSDRPEARDQFYRVAYGSYNEALSPALPSLQISSPETAAEIATWYVPYADLDDHQQLPWLNKFASSLDFWAAKDGLAFSAANAPIVARALKSLVATHGEAAIVKALQQWGHNRVFDQLKPGGLYELLEWFQKFTKPQQWQNIVRQALAPQNLALVELYFIRHGVSCANLVDDAPIPNEAIRDAPLSDIGIRLTKTEMPPIADVDVVVSSFLRRAIETAAYAFPDRTVTPVPYIREIGDDSESRPLTIAQQKAYFARESPELLPRVDFAVRDWFDRTFGQNAGSETYCGAFYQHLRTRVLPQQLQQGDKHIVRIAAVSHAWFIQNCFPLLFPDDPPMNNSIVKVYALYDKSERELRMLGAKRIFQGVSAPMRNGQYVVTARDIQRCKR